MHEGFITRVVVDRGFGFIAEANQRDVFFHASDLADGLIFDETLQEQRVRFEVIETDRGPKALDVRAVN